MAICNDRRWPETYRVMGLQGVELIVLGYNTPSVNSQRSGEGPERRLYHSELSMTSGAYQNATWVVGVAKAGVERRSSIDGGKRNRRSERLSSLPARKRKATSLLVHDCDMDDAILAKTTIFDFGAIARVNIMAGSQAKPGVLRPRRVANENGVIACQAWIEVRLANAAFGRATWKTSVFRNERYASAPCGIESITEIDEWQI